MLVPEAQQTLRVVVPRQLLTTASYQKHSWVMLLEGESGGAGLIAMVHSSFLPLGWASQVSPPGPEKSTIVLPKFEYEASRGSARRVEKAI